MHLMRAIPAQAQRILEVGCSQGRLGAALKASDPHRKVFGIEQQSHASQVASKYLDEVFTLDIQRSCPSIEPGSLDCIVFGEALGKFAYPLEVIQRLSRLLRPGGWIVACIPNVGHHSVITSLLQGDWQYQTKGLLDSRQLRFFTFTSALKLFLDAGFAPEIVDTIKMPATDVWQQAIQGMASVTGTAPERLRYSTNAYQFLIRGQLLPVVTLPTTVTKFTFSVCVSHEEVLHANLLASPDLQQDRSHTILLGTSATSAAAIHNQALERAQTDWVICAHQDVYLPKNWIARFLQRLNEAEAKLGKLSVVGVYGIAGEPSCDDRAGHVLDRSRMLNEPTPLPSLVHSLDELLIAIRCDSGLRFDPGLGWHLYGTDLCLEAQKRGLQSAVIDALCFHNSHNVELPAAFYQSEHYLARKWPEQLPLVTPCKTIERL